MSNKKALDNNHIDEAIDDAYLDAHPLSSLRKPSENHEVKAEEIESPPTKKLKTKHYSSILFVKIRFPSGKKDRSYKTRMVKALVDSGASESMLTKNAAENLTLKKDCSPCNWDTAAGKLSTYGKTNKTTFTFPELHANK